jgi:signal transduction histidine kinase
MNNPLKKPIRFNPLKSTTLLTGLGIFFLIGVILMSSLLYRALTKEHASAEEAEQQITRMAGLEINQLRLSLERSQLGLEHISSLELYYDILFSRAQLLETKRTSKSFIFHVSELDQFIKEIYALEPVVLKYVNAPTEPAVYLRDQIDQLYIQWQTLSQEVFQNAINISTAERETQIELTFFTIAGLILLSLVVIILQVLLRKQINVSQRALERETELVEQLREAAKLALTASDAKSAFLQTMSHELRTPLNAINGFTELMLMGELDEKHTRYLQDIKMSSGKLTTLIHDILDYVDMETGNFKTQLEPFSISHVMEAIKNKTQEHIIHENKELSVHVICPQNLPENLRADRGQIERVLTHISLNAVKFSETGAIHIQAHQDEEYQIRFSIEDNGIGISPENQKMIFEPFSQVDHSSTRLYQGAGLGLAICNKIIELLGGTITVESDLGKGSVFHISIPIKTDA